MLIHVRLVSARGQGAIVKLGIRVALVATILLVAEAAGIALLPNFLRISRGWLLLWPAPEEHFASMIGDLGWPLAILFIAWLLRRPLRRAAYLLSERMKDADLELGNFLKITKRDFNTMDRRAVEHVEAAPAVAEAVDIAESLMEYAGVSDSNATRLLNWIEGNYGYNVDPEAFLTEPEFAEARQAAYIQFIEG